MLYLVTESHVDYDNPTTFLCTAEVLRACFARIPQVHHLTLWKMDVSNLEKIIGCRHVYSRRQGLTGKERAAGLIDVCMIRITCVRDTPLDYCVCDSLHECLIHHVIDVCVCVCGMSHECLDVCVCVCVCVACHMTILMDVCVNVSVCV
jgi:hypothetical protein